MQGRGSYARTIVESELVAARIDAAKERAPHLEELYERGIKWKIARKPESGHKVPENEGFYIAKTYSWRPGGVPSITVLYRFDDEHVYIESSKIDWPKQQGKG